MMSFLQKLLGQRENGVTAKPQGHSKSWPSIWLCKAEHVGDFNNGFAVAEALNSDNLRIVDKPLNRDYAFSQRKSSGDYPVLTRFIDKNCYSKMTIQPVYQKDAPDVLINSVAYKANRVHFSQAIGLENLPHPKKTFAVRISAPDFPINIDPNADLTIVFQHQVKSPEDIKSNMRVYDTVPSPVNKNLLETARKAWGDKLVNFAQARPVYCVVIGERTDNNEALSIQDAKKLASTIAEAIQKTGGSILLTTSVRTQNDKDKIAAFTSELSLQTKCYCYNYHSNEENNNLYLGLLATADKIIVTTDSMSMQSDAIATGKPVYVFNRAPAPADGSINPQNRIGHDAYTQNLLNKNLVLPIELLAEKPSIEFHAVNSAEQIAYDIRLELAKRLAQKHTYTGQLNNSSSAALSI